MKEPILKSYNELLQNHITLHNHVIHHNCRVWARILGEAWRKENKFEEGYLLMFWWGQNN